MTKVNIATMGADVANELRGKSWDERYAWILKIKDEGNVLFKAEKIAEAIDVYMKALCGMDFSSYDHGKDFKARELRVNKELKAPILNNIALCLNKQGKYQRAVTMLDQVLEADPSNAKAWQRKIQNQLLLGEVEEASKTIVKAEKVAVQEDDKSKLRQFKAQIAAIKGKEKDFSKKAFQAPLYQDKVPTPPPTPEQLNKEENEMLATINNIHWLLYPFIKTAKVLCGRGSRAKKD